MGKGGLNRLLLRAGDVCGTRSSLAASDERAQHIRTVLCGDSTVVTIRVAVEGVFLHDSATAHVEDDGSVRIEIPMEGRETVTERDRIVLMVAMQRPKVIARVIEAACCVGVKGIVIVGAEKVEKSYWQCRLFRESDEACDAEEGGNAAAADTDLPGRARKRGERYSGRPRRRRVDHLPLVRRRLEAGVEQGAADASLPWVILEPNGVAQGVHCAEETCGGGDWALVAADVGGEEFVTEVVRNTRADGALLAIGPEGGWTRTEVRDMRARGFRVVGLGRRVLRSENAAVVGLALIHEAVRLRKHYSGVHRDV